ncbi:MAG: AMP-binding protein [Thermodesulfovibrionales bacterium]|nr:AMP-binding protein [Thermodesulfovibrionales bacterium]
MTLKDHFLLSFERFNKRIAFFQPVRPATGERYIWRSFTYEDIKDLSTRLAVYLNKVVSHQDRVLLYAENSVYWCIAYIAIILRGAIAVPLDVESDREGVELVIKDSEVKFVLYSEKTAPVVKEYNGFNIEKVEELLIFDKIEFYEPSEDTIASIIYTSGTTGRPKAVMLTHRNFSFEIEAGKKTGIISSDENVLCILPLHHTYPFVCNFLVPFCLGATISFSPYLRGPEVLKTIKERKITSVIAVPQVLELMRIRILERLKRLPIFLRIPLFVVKRLSSFLRRKYDLNIGRLLFFFLHIKTGFQLRFFASGGARLDPDVMMDLEAFGFTVIEGYGLTETSPVATFNPVKRRKPGSAGKPLDGVELKIINPDETGTGEIAIKGPLVMKGYYKNEELTSQSIQEGWFLTGDLGYIDKDGYLYITGRKKDVIILPSGKTIYPEDIEERYRKAIPLIKEICILDTMEAVIVPDLDYARNKGIVNINSSLKWEIDSLSGKLPSYMRLKGFRLHNEALPKTRLGKFKRFLIRETIEKKSILERKPDPGLETATGKAVLKVLKTLVPSIDNVYLTDHLELDLGLDSLKRLELAAAIEKKFSINLTDDIVARWHILDDVIRDIERLQTLPPARFIPGKRRGAIFRLINRVILRIAHILLRIVFRLLFRLRVQGIDNLPAPPFIITPNHTSYLDGFVLFASLPYRVSKDLYFQGLKKYFPSKFLAELINVISISSDSDILSAMAYSKEILKRGKCLCIFPEGGRSFDGELREFKTGFAILSIEEQVPVVPVIIEGTFKSLPRGRKIPRLSRIDIIIDRPLMPPGGASDAEFLRDKLRERMLKLKSTLSSL